MRVALRLRDAGGARRCVTVNGRQPREGAQDARGADGSALLDVADDDERPGAARSPPASDPRRGSGGDTSSEHATEPLEDAVGAISDHAHRAFAGDGSARRDRGVSNGGRPAA